MVNIAENWKFHLIFGILSIILGVIIAVWPNISVVVYMVIMGVLVLISGFLQVIAYTKINDNIILIKAVATILIGLALVLIPFFMAEVAAIVFAVFFILIGLIMLLGVNGEGNPISLQMRILGIIMIVVGVVICIFPEKAVEIMAIIIGVMMVVVGIVNILIGVQEKKLV